jgi:hypothetical protein
MIHQVVWLYEDWNGNQRAVCACGFYTTLDDIKEHIETENKNGSGQ